MRVLVKRNTFNQGMKVRDNYLGNTEHPETLLGSIKDYLSKLTEFQVSNLIPILIKFISTSGIKL